MTEPKPKIFQKEIDLNKINVILGPHNLKEVFLSTNFSEFDDNITEFYCPENDLNPAEQVISINGIVNLVNTNVHDKIVIYTNSPYVINHLEILVKAGNLYDEYTESEQRELISNIIHIKYAIRNKSLSVFEIDKDKNINLLENHNGIPIDDDYLNKQLESLNEIFSDLLNVQQKIKNEYGQIKK